MGLKWLLDYYRDRQSLMQHALLSFMALLILGLGFGTYVRNMAWATEKSLWEDAVTKAPKSGRALHNLAWGHFERMGHYDQAMQLYQKSLESETHSKVRKTMTLNNIANLYYLKKNYKKAAELWRRASDRSPEIEFVQFRLALALAKSGDLIAASTLLTTLIEKRPERADYNFLKGSILLKQQQLSFCYITIENPQIRIKTMISVDELMTNDPFTLKPTDTLETARHMMTDKHIRHIPITDDLKHLVGLVTQRDILQATGPNTSENPVLTDIMIHDVNVITRNDSVRAAAMHLRQHKYGCLPVVEDNRVVGIITDSDFITVAIHLLEQIDAAEEIVDDFEPDDLDDLDMPVLDEQL